MTSDNVFVSLHCVLGRVEVKLAAVEGLNVRLLGDEAQPDVVESEHPGEVAGVVHLHQRVPGQDVGARRHVRRPEVEGVLEQVHEPLGPLVAHRPGPREHVAREQLHVGREVEVDQLIQFPTSLFLVIVLVEGDDILVKVSGIVDWVAEEGEHIPGGDVVVVIHEHVEPALGARLHRPSQPHRSLERVIEICVLKIPLDNVFMKSVLGLNLGLELDIVQSLAQEEDRLDGDVREPSLVAPGFADGVSALAVPDGGLDEVDQPQLLVVAAVLGQTLVVGILLDVVGVLIHGRHRRLLARLHEPGHLRHVAIVGVGELLVIAELLEELDDPAVIADDEQGDGNQYVVFTLHPPHDHRM